MLTTIPISKVESAATMTIKWSTDTTISGNHIKGFATTNDGQTVYVVYTFPTEEEKENFKGTNPASIEMTLEGEFKEIDLPAHSYSFSMSNYLRMNGSIGLFESKKLIQMDDNNSFVSRMSERRWKLKNHIKTTFPSSLAPEATALLLGDKSAMNDEQTENYRTLGITHLFALSGLHVGLLVFIIRNILMRAHLRIETVDIVLIVLLPLYAFLVGGAPSIWRAVTVTVLLLINAHQKTKMRVDDALSLCAILFVCYEPHIVFHVGFQLSYLAAISLVYSTRILSRLKSAFLTTLLVSVITQLAVYPVILYHFFEVSLSSIIMNSIYVPLYSFLILPLNILLLLFTFFFTPLAELLFFFYVPIRGMLEMVTNWLAAIPFQLWNPGRPNPLLLIAAYGSVLYSFINFEKYNSIVRSLPVVVIMGIVIHYSSHFNGFLSVTYLDVGQGDCIIIEFPYKRATYVIDTGGTVQFGERDWKTPEKKFEVGRKIVVPFLKGRGIQKIDKLILSHADSDHMEGADEVMEEVDVKEIHISPGSELEKNMTSVLRLAKKEKIAIIPMQKGYAWKEGDNELQYLWPNGDTYSGNDSSLVLLLMADKLSFLFTGDLEKNGEMEFVSNFKHVDWNTIILKAGHHGSKTSSSKEFVSMLMPKFTIFSAGKRNRYGHPHPDVLQTFNDLNLKTLSTKEEGSITVVVSQNGYVIKTMKE